MQLYFCSVCGVSIPQNEIDSGVASAGEDRYLCSEHRQDANDAKLDDGDVDVELLFCANCHVSIPQGDVKSGRAPREFGSLLCRHCAPLDPPGRAGRRHAVEHALADEESDDLIAAPAGAAGPAPVSVSQSPTTSTRSSGGGAGLVAALVIVALGFGIGGWALGEYVVKPAEDDRLAELERRLESRVLDVERSVETVAGQVDTAEMGLDELSRSQAATAEAVEDEVEGQVRDLVDDSLRDLRGDLAALRGELTGADAAIEKRLDRIEGRMEDLLARFQTAIAAAAARQDDGGRREPVADDDDPEPDGPAPEQPEAEMDPQVAQLARDLIESNDESTRFTAATELGRLGDPASIPALAKAVEKDDHYLVRRAAARSLGTLKAWNAVPVLIEALEEKEAYVAQQASYALEEITGQDFGVTQELSTSQRRSKAKAAQRWWQQNGDAPPEGVSLQPVASN